MHSQRGNILFLILLAVVLFAALSYAVTGSMNNGGKNASTEKAQLDQSVVDNFQAQIDAAALRLKMGGCTTVYYTPPSEQPSSGDKSCYIFSTEGASVPWQDIGLDGCTASGGSLTSLAVGQTCGNLIYAGTYSSRRMYVMSSGSTNILWKASGTNAVSTGTGDGLANTDVLLATGSSYPAARLCRNFGTKWYLPSYNEMNAVYPNKNVGNLTGWTGAGYWTSTWLDASNSRTYSMTSGTGGSMDIQSGGAVRCFRRD